MEMHGNHTESIHVAIYGCTYFPIYTNLYPFTYRVLMVPSSPRRGIENGDTLEKLQTLDRNASCSPGRFRFVK